MKITFADRLKELRGSLSQADFAYKIRAKQTSYSSWERGVKEPGVSTVVEIANTFGVSADWLLGLSDQRAPVIEAPRQNNVSKTPEIREKFPSFVRPICRTVRQYYKDTTN